MLDKENIQLGSKHRQIKKITTKTWSTGAKELKILPIVQKSFRE